jgi:hypothetical protein
MLIAAALLVGVGWYYGLNAMTPPPPHRPQPFQTEDD